MSTSWSLFDIDPDTGLYRGCRSFANPETEGDPEGTHPGLEAEAGDDGADEEMEAG